MASDPNVSARAPARDPAAHRDLDDARERYWEDPAGARAVASSTLEDARALGDPAVATRALALQGAIAIHTGDLRRAFARATEAEQHAERGADDGARAELAALKAQLSFFSGSYAEALHHAELSIELADRVADLALRLFVRRCACIVFGNVGVVDLEQRFDEVLQLAIASGARWQEAISRNDIAHRLMDAGDVARAAEEIERAFAIAIALAPDNRFALGVLHCTRAEIRLRQDRAPDGLEDSDRAIALLAATDEPNPYLLAMTVVVKVRALLALDRLDDAHRAGEGALQRLGDRLPQAQSLILTSLAAALREAGRVDEAYDALARSAELERQAFQELSALQLGLERATLEAAAARREAEAYAAKNRELETAVRDLAQAQSALADQADRDWLTGLHNRRFLAREIERMTGERRAGPFSLAVLDLDHFKSINDRFGHDAGDQVLVRVAALLIDVLRGSDVVVRSGGEEFVVLMPFTDAAAALAAAERIRSAISREPWSRIAGGLVVTASVGVASAGQASHLDELAKLADRRLYEAKRAGRDRVVGEGDGG